MMRTFRVELKDGTVEDLTTSSFPWIYREWWCIADEDGAVSYRPKSEVRCHAELVPS